MDAKQWRAVIARYETCEDVQFGTVALKHIRTLMLDRAISTKEAGSLTDDIWAKMNEYVVGMDGPAYTEYFNLVNLTGSPWKCNSAFEQMIDIGLKPSVITLNALLRTCRMSGNVETALRYWTTIVNDMLVPPTAESWACFLSVCAKKPYVELAEECFEDCPFKHDAKVLYRMMDVYKNAFNMEKVLELKEFMETENIEMNVDIFNTVAAAHRRLKQWKPAIKVNEEMLERKEYDLRTIAHLLRAKTGLLQELNDEIEKKRILRYIETNIVDYHKEFGRAGTDTLKSIPFANEMLKAYLAVNHKVWWNETASFIANILA